MMEIERPGNPHPPLKDRSDSVSSIDRELDWLIGSENEENNDAVEIDTEEPYERSESRREEPSSYVLDQDAGEQNHETALDGDHEEQETVVEDSQSEEQRLLEMELQKLKEEGFLPMEDPPEYDIADRVRELNEQLKAEGETPEKTDRKVKFSEEVIAVEFPEELYGNEDDNEGEANQNGMEQPGDANEGEGVSDGTSDSERTQEPQVTDPNDLEVAKLTLGEEKDHAEIEPKEMQQYDQNKPNGNSQSPRGEDEKILIERDGKFELISVRGLTPTERRSMGLELSPVQDETDQSRVTPVTPNGHGDAPVEDPVPQEVEVESPLQPRPPSKPRPSTATDSTGLRRSQLPPRRIQSARTQRDLSGSQQGAWTVAYTGHSKYGLTPEQKEHKREQMRLRMQQRQELRQAEEEEQRKKREEAESAFQAWLEHKREAEKERKRQEKEQKKNNDDKKDQSSIDDNFQAWLQMKQSQARRERKLRKQAEEEKNSGYFLRDRRECDQAFRQWVRSKNEQLKKERLLKRSNATVSRQLARQSRKSKNLAKALETAQIYRYTDWYGYRF
ncbi:coiled-coil domain-containing protein 181-like [Acanthaster planci]|uniref:Coiled-coil domain-containing protein 181 n=1 Tax=Acanthaster planci TaxID=133434 RepID=A0A8B7Z0A4_ACAPL|nr:coiled-coil domain-containing protein 181-like [Acanthaster planci]